MYNLELKFDTTMFVSVFNKEISKMLKNCHCDETIGHEVVVNHTMTIEKTPVIPDKKFIDETCETIFNEMKNSFTEFNDREVTVLKTTFVGFTNIEEIKETEA